MYRESETRHAADPMRIGADPCRQQTTRNDAYGQLVDRHEEGDQAGKG